jgi:predicted DNA-binding transcriptional regulator YafY
MPITKNAWIRYKALDACLSNQKNGKTITELVEACNRALEAYDSTTGGVNKRQVYYDLQYLESESGYQADIEKIKDGKQVYYRYEDPQFSIIKSPLKSHEIQQLQRVLELLQRVGGLPEFEGLEELRMKLASKFQMEAPESSLIAFEQNPFLKGLEYLQPLWEAIQNKQALTIRYQGFKQTAEQQHTIYPYYLKQYNSRWFLFAWNTEKQAISNFALDRIRAIESMDLPWRNNTVNLEEWLEDAVGVSIPENAPVETIILKVDQELLPYLETKPIHGSQKVLKQSAALPHIQIQVYINFELKRLLLSYGPQIEVLEPTALRNELRTLAEGIVKRHQ